jgi:hypothetical protein
MTSDSIIAWCLRMSENILLLALRTAPNRGGLFTLSSILHFPRTQPISQPSPLLDSSDRKVCRPRLPLRRLRCICPEPRFPGRSWWFYVMRCTSVSAPALGDVLCPELDCLVQLEISAEARTGGSLHQARWTLVAGFELWFELPHVLMTCKCVSGARARGTGSSAGPGRWVTSEAP